MRLIDANRLKLILMFNTIDPLEAIDNMPTVEPKRKTGHWIPVSERLPEEEDYKPSYEVSDGVVLVTTEDGLVGEGYFYNSTKTWSDIMDNPISVIAWMPLLKYEDIDD